MIDCDVHILIGDADEFLDYIDPGQREWFATRGPLLGLPDYPWAHPVSWFREDAEHDEQRLAGTTVEAIQRQVLDPFGTDIAVLDGDDAIAVSLMASATRAEAFARAHNRWLAERWLSRDSRLRGGVLCPAQDPVAAAAEIRRTAVDERFAHLLLVGGAERPYGDPRYLPIFEAAVECGLPVAIHSGGEGMGIAAPPGGAGLPNHYIEWHTVGSAGSIMTHLVSMICNGLFDRFPTLKVLMMEGGIAWLPGMLWRLDTNWRGLRTEIPWVTRRPSEVVREQIRFTTQPLEHTDGRDDLLFEMLEAAGAPEILCFASDYPHWDGDDPAFMLKRLPESWRERVMHGTAEDLYGERLGLAARSTA
jgi:predicted TIM-barrel fold metal-dependent hydrolase